MKIITAAVIKGGVGKTATCAALAQAAAADGQRVLVIDLDPQGNLSFAVGADQTQPGSYELLHGAPAAQLIQDTAQGLAAIPAGQDLSTETSYAGSAKRLQDAIEPIKNDFDFIVIDTPPTLGELQYNALQASTGLLIPLETDTSSLQGLYQIADIAHQLQKTNPALSITGIILNKYDGRPKFNRYLKDVIAAKGQELGIPLLQTIRAGVVIREAQGMQQSLFDYAAGSKPAADYWELYQKIKQA